MSAGLGGFGLGGAAGAGAGAGRSSPAASAFAKGLGGAFGTPAPASPAGAFGTPAALGGGGGAAASSPFGPVPSVAVVAAQPSPSAMVPAPADAFDLGRERGARHPGGNATSSERVPSVAVVAPAALPAALPAPAESDAEQHSESDSDSDSDLDFDLDANPDCANENVKKVRRWLVGDAPDAPDALRAKERSKIEARRGLLRELYQKAAHLLFLPDDGYNARPLNDEDVRKMSDPDDVNMDKREKILDALLQNVIEDGIQKKDSWRTFFAASPSREIRNFPTISGLRISRLLCRSELDFKVVLTPGEEEILKKTMEEALDNIVAKGGRTVPEFFVRLTTCDADGKAALAFPADAESQQMAVGDAHARPQSRIRHGRWLPGKKKAADGACIGSLIGTMWGTLRSKGARDGERSEARHVRKYKEHGYIQESKTFMPREKLSESQMACPLLPLAFRLTVGGSATRLALPKEVVGTGRGTWTKEAMKRYNLLGQILRKERRVPPHDDVVANTRLLPESLCGAPASETLPRSCFEEEVPQEGTPSTLRDRALAAGILREIVETDVNILQALERANLGGEHAFGDKQVADDLFLYTFDSLGQHAQIVVMFIIAVVIEEAMTRALRLDPDFATRVGAINIIAYARCVREWVRSVLKEKTGYKDPTRRRMQVLVLLGLIPCGYAHLFKRGLHASLPRALSLANAAMRTFADFGDLAECLSLESLRRMEQCDDALGDAFAESDVSDDAQLLFPRGDVGDASWIWYIHVRASTHEQFTRAHSARSQFAAACWTLRRHAERKRRAGGALPPPAEIVLSVAVGSKLYPRRVNSFVMNLAPGGAAFQALVAFAFTFAADDAALAADAASNPLPPALVANLVSNETRTAVLEEMIAAIVPVVDEMMALDQTEPLGVVMYGARSAYIPGGGTRSDFNTSHLPGFGAGATLRTIEALIARRRASESAPPLQSGNLVAISGQHDRRSPGFVTAMSPGAQIRLRAVACLASSAVARVRPELAVEGFLSTSRARRVIEAIAWRGAICTAQYSLTLASGDRFYSKNVLERERRARTYAHCINQLLAWKAYDAGVAARVGSSVEQERATGPPPDRAAILLHRRSNPQEGLFGTQVQRTRRVLAQVCLPQHKCVHLVFLDGFNGTDRVPVAADPLEGRRVYAKKLAERDAGGRFPVVALDVPQGEERDDLGAFVIPMMEAVIRGEGAPRVADIIVPSMSRVCLEGAVDALAELDARGWRFFAWDLLEAAAVDGEFRGRMLRNDSSVRLDSERVKEELRDIALADRAYRHVHGFVMPIRN